MDRYAELSQALLDNRVERAGELCRELLGTAPDNVELLTLSGALARQRGELDSALGFFSRAAAVTPSLAQLQNNLGVVLEDLGRHQDAVGRYREALALKPDYCEASCNLGNALRSLGRSEEALCQYRAALAIDPAYTDAHYNLGNTLRAGGRWQDPRLSYRELVALEPGHLSGWINLGGTLHALNRCAEAIEAQHRALEIDPESADAHWNLALALLATGDFLQGWREYQWRLKGAAFPASFAGRPIWDGSPLAGRTLLLRAEQGFGDALQFYRYAPLLAREGVNLVLECRPELLPLFAAQSPGVECFPAGEEPPEFDTFAYLMSLPFLLGTTLSNLPSATPYLGAEPGLSALWGKRLGGEGALKVGVVWAGSAGYRNDRYRSLPLEALAPLARLPGVRLYSLQMGAAAGDLAALPWGSAVCDLSGSVRDFSDTAAIIANLDLVVSVDTAVAHLAGALGKPVCLMLPLSCDWRWLSGRSDSPWYPTLRLYRQETAGEWGTVVAAIANDLARERGELNGPFRAANALRLEGRYSEAVDAYRRLLSLRPDCAEIHNNLGLALQDLGRLDQALQSYRRALSLNGALADAHNNLGTVLVSRGERETAVACFEKALALRGDFLPAYLNLGCCLQNLGRPEQALPLYLRALALEPRSVEARINLGTCYQELMQPQQAIAVYQEALALDPQHPGAHWNLALSLLSVGDFERGWREYEWRFPPDPRLRLDAPRWDGGPLAGLTILIECEQGLGDTLQFVRYATLVAERGATVLLQCQSATLKPLLARVAGVAAVFAQGEALPPFHCRAPLISLPRIFGTTLERLPDEVPYLGPDPLRAAAWRLKLPPGAALKVGLVWRGGPLPRNRACPFEELAPLAGVAGVAWYSLQLGERPLPELLPALDLSGQIGDFGDSAAIIANLDLVLSVDTATAHLAGGMGVPVWTLLPHACDWRWLAQRSDSPWYPSMRLFRQERPGDWRGVVTRVADELDIMRRGKMVG